MNKKHSAKQYLSDVFKNFFLPFILLLSVADCSSNNETPFPEPEPSLLINLQHDTIPCNSRGQFLDIQTDGEWNIRLTFAETLHWCSVNPARGQGEQKIVLSYTTNPEYNQRYVLLQVTSSGQSETRLLTQLGTSGLISNSIPIILSPGNDNPPPPNHKPDPEPEPDPEPIPSVLPKRLELPAVKNPRWFLEYKYMALEYDTLRKHSVWVAYVLNKKYLEKNVSRSDAWKFDSRIPAHFSPTKEDFGSNGYSRGHLCPSGDRLSSREANTETFYYSNMSPQIQNGYNGGIWGQLEDKVRTWAVNCDTLYIVTGGTILQEENIIRYTSPSHMAVPRYHFKALLRRRGDTFDAIGFILEHKVYTDKISHKYSLSIDELEQKTGIDFFHNLPDDMENTIESRYEPENWNI